MELLREWFLWGESDLFIFGVIIIVIAAFFPLRLEKNRKNRIIIVACLAIYAMCELVVTFWFQNWLRAYVCLFLGGIAFSIAAGRIAKMVWVKYLVNK